MMAFLEGDNLGRRSSRTWKTHVYLDLECTNISRRRQEGCRVGRGGSYVGPVDLLLESYPHSDHNVCKETDDIAIKYLSLKELQLRQD